MRHHPGIMRSIGTIKNEADARRFVDYLLTQQVEANLSGAATKEDGFEVWVVDEDQLDDASRELDAFRADPLGTPYVDAVATAKLRRQQMLDAEIAARKRTINLRSRWDRPAYIRGGITILLMILSGAATLYTKFGKDFDRFNELRIQSMFQRDGGMYTLLWLDDVTNGEVWRLVTPIFVHLTPIHILFNMMMLYQLGIVVEALKGHFKYFVLILTTAVLSNAAQFYFGGSWLSFGGPQFGGMSGVVYGLFGYLWFKSMFAPDEGIALNQQSVFIMIGWLVFCMVAPGMDVANMAHFAGLVVGGLVGVIGKGIRTLRG